MKMRKTFLFHATLFTFIIIFWEWSSRKNNLAFFLGSPQEILLLTYENTVSGHFPYHSLITGSEALVGLILGTVIGASLGLLSWYSKYLKLALQPYIFIASVIPIFSFSPVIIIWFGIGYSMKVVLATFAASIISYSEASYSSDEVSDIEIKRLSLMGARKLDILRIFIFPSTLNRIILSAKRNVSASLLGAFIGEFLSANSGIAAEMIKAGALYQVSYVCAACIYLIMLAFIMLGVVAVIERYKNKIIACLSVRATI